MTIGLIRIPSIVVLVVFFCRVEPLERLNFCHDWLFPDTAGFDLGYCRLSTFLLFFIMVEYDRAILRADIVALTVKSGWIVNREEHLEQFVITDLLGVILNLTHLSMTRPACAHLLVRGILDIPARVSRDYGGDAL